jgi:predicted DNA-binding transcriptional regulator YafY
MQAPTDTLVRRAVQVLRAGDRAANRTTDRAAYWSSDPGAHWNSNPVRDPARDRVVYQAAFRRLLQPDSTAELLDRLQEAVQTEAALQIGYVDDYGAVSEHEVHPLLVQGGYLTAYNRAQQRIETFAIHRIVDVDPPDLPE